MAKAKSENAGKKTSKKSKSSSAIDSTQGYSTLKKIVWAFADMARDTGNGTVEDYAKIVLPTLMVKRVLDMQEEWNLLHANKEFEALEIGAEPLQVLRTINQKSFRFYDSELLTSVESASVLLLNWTHLISFKENPNAQEVVLPLTHGQSYATKARDFLELMFEISDKFSKVIQHVFTTFEFKRLLVDKKIVPVAEYSRTCHEELSSMSFSQANVSIDMFGDTYMDLVGKFAEDSGKKGGEFFTPTTLVSESIKFLDLKEIANKLTSGKKTTISIGDPTSGSNTYCTQAMEGIRAQCNATHPGLIAKEAFRLYGQELKAFQFCLGQMNMVFHGVIDQYNVDIGDFSCQNANVITHYNKGIGKKRQMLDIVVANPPYGTKNYGVEYAEANKTLEPRWANGVPTAQEGEFAFLATIIDLLNKEGKAVVVMPLGTLFRKTGAKFRKAILTEDILEGLVVLPSNMFLTTQIPVVLWIINKNKKEEDKGKVFMVNASHDFVKVDTFNNWQAAKSVEAYLSRTAIEDYCGYVEISTLEKNSFNLSVHRYFGKVVESDEIDIVELQNEISEIERSLKTQRETLLDSLFAQAIALETTELEVGNDENLGDE